MDAENPPEKRSKWGFYLRYTLFLIIILLAAGEITVRIMGYRPWSPAYQHLTVTPGPSMFVPDSALGYIGRPGHHEVVIENAHHFAFFHDKNGLRPTSNALPDTLLPEIWIFGCSFTHGFGVNDDQNYPWMLQEALSGYRIRNFAMSGYGTLQSLIQLESALETLDTVPELVILAYGAFHDQRNTSNRMWRKILSGREVTSGLRYPHVRFGENDALVRGFSHLEYDEFPAQRFSALSHYLEMGHNRREDEGLRSYDMSKRLIDEMRAISEKSGAKFLLAGIFQHDGTTQMLKEFREKGGAAIDISQDHHDPRLRIMAEDSHPNEKSHRLMKNALLAYLNEFGFGAERAGNSY